MAQLRQPRLAEIIAGKLREDILEGRLREGDFLGNREQLFNEYQVSPPALREALCILETDGLISVRRGNIGGAVVHAPTSARAAQMIAMVLQTRSTPPTEVAESLRHLEPICAGLCAAREDRAEEVVPVLRALTESQRASLHDAAEFERYAHEFHGQTISLCGNEAMIVVIGALEAIWASHAPLVWQAIADNPQIWPEGDPLQQRREALRSHTRLVDVIEKGDVRKANQIVTAHLDATTPATARGVDRQTVQANRVGGFGAEPAATRRRVG